MNILIITLTYKPSLNGVAIYTSRLVKWLRKNGHTVWVIGPKVKNLHDGQYLPLPTFYDIPFMPGDYPVALPILNNEQFKTLNQIKWDIIHVQHPSYFAKFAVSLGKKLAAPAVFTYHTHYQQYIQIFANWLPEFTQKEIYEKEVVNVCKQVQAVFVNTLWVKQMLKHKVKVPIYLTPTSGLEKLFYNKNSRITSRKQLKIPPDKSIFLSVSRLDKVKNIAFLIRAFARWRQNHIGYLVLVGDGNERPRLTALAEKLNCGSSVRFVGAVPNVDTPFWYNLADVFLFSSGTDTLGNSIIEAMSAGLPVVALNYPATASVVIPGKNGYLSRNSMAEFIKKMELAYVKKQEMQPHALATAGKYLLSKTMPKTLDLYQKIIFDYKKSRRNRLRIQN